MIGAKIPMMIFLLASGYLFAVYLLLALAKRGCHKITHHKTLPLTGDELSVELSVNTSIQEVINSQ